MQSASALRAARTAAGLSQRALAERAGVTQSVISAYESGAREPALSTLTRLVAAAGAELHVELRPGTATAGFVARGPLARRLRQRRRAVLRTAADHGASNVRVFGSVARGDEHDGSDVDLLVDLQPGTSLVGLAGLTRKLEELLGTTVDVVPTSDLKPALRPRVHAEAVAL